MHWKAKGLIQGVLARVPAGTWLNSQLQIWVGQRRNFEGHVDNKVTDALILAKYLVECGRTPEGLEFMEIGTGWLPVLPVCWHLTGATRVHTFDIHRHLQPVATLRAVQLIGPRLSELAEAAGVDSSLVTSRHERLLNCRTADEILSIANIEYHSPGDATQTGLPDQSVDVTFSNSVMEHVPGPVIAAMMHESARVLRPGGASIHSINCGDHYAYFDNNVTMMNYYQFTEREWELWNNSILYQNRLRPSDFLKMATDAGLEIAHQIVRPREDLLAALPQQKLAPEFQRYSKEDLCSTTCDFAAVKPGTTAFSKQGRSTITEETH